ncbi:MAG: patatin-like phospholipase family protein [Burkholderiales bacterium]
MIRRWRTALLLVTLLSGCASTAVVQNPPSASTAPPTGYSLSAWSRSERPDDILLNLAFSGGGTRAAALSYGVLKALRDTEVTLGGQPRRLLDEVDAITSVSGGSFTAAYYGLYGDRTFTDFERVFLRRDVEQALISRIVSPASMLDSAGRTESAIKDYDENVFHGATYADLAKANGPLIVINASDLGHGVRFSFLQEYFSLLCSELMPFPVARAVAASSAVPVLFSPVVVRNYPDCGSTPPPWLAALRERSVGDERTTQLVDGLASYFDKDKRKFIHFVDGGVTDNLGLRATFDIIETIGGPIAYLEKFSRRPPREIVFIVVNAATEPELGMDRSEQPPSLLETVQAMNDIQVHRYSVDTIELTKQSLAEWAKALSTPDRPVAAYFIQLSFRNLAPERRSFFNQIPTRLALNDAQVDALIAAGAELLRTSPEFQRLLADLSR